MVIRLAALGGRCPDRRESSAAAQSRAGRSRPRPGALTAAEVRGRGYLANAQHQMLRHLGGIRRQRTRSAAEVQGNSPKLSRATSRPPSPATAAVTIAHADLNLIGEVGPVLDEQQRLGEVRAVERSAGLWSSPPGSVASGMPSRSPVRDECSSWRLAPHRKPARASLRQICGFGLTASGSAELCGWLVIGPGDDVCGFRLFPRRNSPA
jgi:hypothetical protein